MKRFLAHILVLLTFITSLGSTPGDSVKVYFRKGYSRFEPEFDNNRANMDRFLKEVRKAMAENDVDSVVVSAYASPDGTERNNIRVSTKRCNSLIKIIEEETSLSPTIIKSNPQGIAWSELRNLVAADFKTPARNQILEILDNTPVWITDSNGKIIDGRKNRLMSLNGGIPYNWMVKNLFPKLRIGVAAIIYRKEATDTEVSTREVCPEPTTNLQVAPVQEVIINEAEIADTVAPVAETLPEHEPLHRFALKNNLVFDAALMPNLELEWRINSKWSAAVEGGIAWWYKNSSHRSYRLAYADVEGRFWAYTRAPWHGLYIGAFTGGTIYDLENRKTGYKGEGVFAGVSCGYMWSISRCFSMEAAVGAGYLYTKYKEYEPFDGHNVYMHTRSLDYFGPLKAKLAIVWRFNDINKKQHRVENK